MSEVSMRHGGISFTIPAGYEADPEKVIRMWQDIFERHGGKSIVLPVAAVILPPDPRAARDRQRAEIDAVLREDRQRFPAFATARMAAVMAAVEMWGDEAQVLGSVRAMLNGGWLHAYEEKRGGLTKPREEANAWARQTFGTVAQGHYEAARGMR